MARAISLFSKHVYSMAIGVCALAMAIEGWAQLQEDELVRETATRIIAEAHAETPREQVIALREFVRDHVTFHRAPGTPGLPDDRPFLRATAADTLRSGLGYCGEDSRLFINLALSIGIRAQRVNLYGRVLHVVAEVELDPHERLVVDAQNPPLIPDLEPLDEVILRPEYDDYYTLNLRRLHLGWLVSRIRLEMGPVAYWAENPHALTAALWSAALALLLAAGAARIALRKILHRRGWVHRSALPAATMPAREGAPTSAPPPMA